MLACIDVVQGGKRGASATRCDCVSRLATFGAFYYTLFVRFGTSCNEAHFFNVQMVSPGVFLAQLDVLGSVMLMCSDVERWRKPQACLSVDLTMEIILPFLMPNLPPLLLEEQCRDIVPAKLQRSFRGRAVDLAIVVDVCAEFQKSLGV